MVRLHLMRSQHFSKKSEQLLAFNTVLAKEPATSFIALPRARSPQNVASVVSSGAAGAVS